MPIRCTGLLRPRRCALGATDAEDTLLSPNKPPACCIHHVLASQNILSAQEVATARSLLGNDAPWVDGRSSAGCRRWHTSATSNSRRTAPRRSNCAPWCWPHCSATRCFSAALPKKIFNPLFNRYSGENNFYGPMWTAPLRSKVPDQWVRSDISCTLFLTDPQGLRRRQAAHAAPAGRTRRRLPGG